MPDTGDAGPRHPQFQQHKVEEAVTVLHVDGELDIGSADALRSALDAAEAQGYRAQLHDLLDGVDAREQRLLETIRRRLAGEA